jgi:hypothetical protein
LRDFWRRGDFGKVGEEIGRIKIEILNMRFLQFSSKSLTLKNMRIEIRKAKEKDFSAILSLVKELATFEKAPEKVTNTVEQMKNEKIAKEFVGKF